MPVIPLGTGDLLIDIVTIIMSNVAGLTPFVSCVLTLHVSRHFSLDNRLITGPTPFMSQSMNPVKHFVTDTVLLFKF